MAFPNISEGRDLALFARLVERVEGTPGVTVVDSSADADHNRSVISILGTPEAVLQAVMAMSELALEQIDMRNHTGEHPRQGVIDVCAFIPIRNVSVPEAVRISERYGRFMGDRGVSVYYYEAAARTPERRSLPDLRRGEYEGLAAKLSDPAWLPDEGPSVLNARSGATVTGARIPLIAFNANLGTSDLEIADRICRAIRHVSGGFRYVRALPFMLEEKGLIQVSMNLTDYRKTPLATVLETIRREAGRYGVQVVETELIGTIPAQALVDAASYYMQAHDLSADQIIEMSLLEGSE